MGFCVDVLLRLAAQQQQAKTKIGLDVTASCANVTNRTDYTKKNTDCNIFNLTTDPFGFAPFGRLRTEQDMFC